MTCVVVSAVQLQSSFRSTERSLTPPISYNKGAFKVATRVVSRTAIENFTELGARLL